MTDFSSDKILNEYARLNELDWTLNPDSEIYSPDITPEEREDECIERNAKLDERFNCDEGGESEDEINWNNSHTEQRFD